MINQTDKGGAFNNNPSIQKGNIMKAMRTAIQEFMNNGATVQKLDSTADSDENKRLIVIFTSLFEIGEQVPEDKIKSLMLKLHALRINVIVFGYEMDIVKSVATNDLFKGL